MARSEHSDVGAYFEATKPSLINLSAPNTKCAGERWILLQEPIASTENVYVARARDSKHGIVAVKFARSPAIEREARILRALTVAGVHGVVRGHGCCYMIPFYGISMELHRTNIAWQVESNGVMQLGRVATLGKGLISTLRSVHELGIIHNDVKPENIVTTTNQSFYLIDWGSARYKSDSVPHFPVGTPAYMSLRALEGESNNERNDLESLLYTLLYAAYGQLPWALNEPKAKSDFVFIARQRRAFRVQQISSLCPDVLQRFLDICRFDHSMEDSVYEDLITLLDSLS